MPKCPWCGSTAQVKYLIGGAYICGCGQMFYEVNGEIKTANQICEEIEKAEKRG